MKRSSAPCAPRRAPTRMLALVSLVLLYAACDAPTVELGGRRLLDAALTDAADASSSRRDADSDDNDSPDADDRDDESIADLPRPCTNTSQCDGEDPFCSLAMGYCVECLRDEHCTKPNERCEPDGECDDPG